MQLWKRFSELMVTKTLHLKKNAVMKIDNSDGTTSEVDLTELAALDNISAADLAKIDGITNGTQAAGKAVVPDVNVNTGVSKVTALHIGASGAETMVNATAAELNKAADISARVQELTVSGAVTAGVQSVELNHATVVIAATVAAVIGAHDGLMVVKNTSASGTAAHTVTLTGGTWNGTNTIATLNAPDECLVVYFDSAGNGTVVENVGTIVLS